MKIEELNLNLLKTFYHVAKEGNITRTAEKYYTSQPAISRAIRQLEEDYDAKLFYRTLSGVELTEKGNILFKTVENMFNDLNQTEAKIKDIDGFEKGRLKIGAPSQIAAIYLFEAISKFHKTYPQVEISIVSKPTAQLIKLLKNHEIDFMIDTAPIILTGSNYVCLQIKEFENCFFVNSKFSLSEICKIKKLADLKDYPIILPVPNTANRKVLDELFFKQGLKFKNVLNIHTSEMIISAVRQDAGIGYTIKKLVEESAKSGDFSILNLNDELPKIEVCLVYEKNKLTKISNSFLTQFLKICL